LLKLALHRIIPADLAAEGMIGVVLFVILLRILGLRTLMNRVRIPKTLAALGGFAWSLSGEDPAIASLLAVSVFGVAVMLFGIYFMATPLFRTAGISKSEPTALIIVGLFFAAGIALIASVTAPFLPR
jgi:hypothetical protein